MIFKIIVIKLNPRINLIHEPKHELNKYFTCFNQKSYFKNQNDL